LLAQKTPIQMKIVGVAGNLNGLWRGFLNKSTGKSEANLEGTRTPRRESLPPLKCGGIKPKLFFLQLGGLCLPQTIEEPWRVTLNPLP
jgi:hypothetical protein